MLIRARRSEIRLAACALALATMACSDDPERPPPYTAPSPEELRSCIELRQRGELVGDEFSIDNEPANCAALGMECALTQSTEVTARCDAGRGHAWCDGRVWRFNCQKSGSDSGA